MFSYQQQFNPNGCRGRFSPGITLNRGVYLQQLHLFQGALNETGFPPNWSSSVHAQQPSLEELLTAPATPDRLPLDMRSPVNSYRQPFGTCCPDTIPWDEVRFEHSPTACSPVPYSPVAHSPVAYSPVGTACPGTIPWGPVIDSPSGGQPSGYALSPVALPNRCGLKNGRDQQISAPVQEVHNRRFVHPSDAWRRRETTEGIVPASAKGVDPTNISRRRPTTVDHEAVARLATPPLTSAHRPPHPSKASPLRQYGAIVQGLRCQPRTFERDCVLNYHQEMRLQNQSTSCWAAVIQSNAETTRQFKNLRQRDGAVAQRIYF